MNLEMSLAAVSMRSALKYRRNWNKNGPAVQLLQSLMPQGGKKKGYRLYLEPGKQMKMRFTVPPAVRVAVQKAGYIITDYLAKKCVKANDKEQKNVFNIGKVIAKDQHAKAAFDNDPQLQNTKTGAVQVVISCHPYDIIGMSTGRDWDKQSCMRLKDYREDYNDGQYNRHVKNDVAEGTLVAYAIHADDTNIQKPLCRCLLKPFKNEEGDVLYRRETSVYGNSVPGFSGALNTFLRKINAHVPEGFYEVVSGLYNDGGGTEHNHRILGEESSINAEDVQEDPSLIVPYVKERLAEKPVPAEAIFATISRYAALLHADDIALLTEMMKGNASIGSEYANQISMGHLNPVLAEIGRKAGFMDSFGEKERLGVYKELPPSLHGRFAQSGLPVLREYVLRMEAEHNVARMRELVAGLMTGTYPVPDETTFVGCPKVKSWIYTMASAARFMPLFGDVSFEKQVHDLVAVLDGTPKIINDDIVEESLHIGPFTVGLSLCLLLDNDNDPKLSADAVFTIPVEEAAPVVCKRRPFKAFERLKNTHTQFFMEHVKLLVFQQCLKGTGVQDQYKDVKKSVVEYMTANPENFASTRWEQYTIKSLCIWELSLLPYVENNTNGLGRNIHDVVACIMVELDKWKGAPIDPDENVFIESLLRTAVAAGRLLDPPMTLSHKVALEDMGNDEFYVWYKANKDAGFPQLSQLFGYMNVDGRKLEMLSIIPLLVEAANAPADKEDNMAFARFGMNEVARSHRQIIRTIKGLPLLGTALTQFENFCESLTAEETEDEEEAGRALIDGEEMGVELNPEDDDYDVQYDDLLEEAKKIIEDRNFAKVELNSKISQVASQILVQIGYDDDNNYPDMRQFFDNFSEEDLEDYESNLENSGSSIVDHLTSMIQSAEEYRQIAGYS